MSPKAKIALWISAFSILMFLALGSLYFGVMIYNLETKRHEMVKATMEKETQLVDAEKHIISNDLNKLIADVFILRDNISSNLNEDGLNENQNRIEKDWLSIIENKKIYDQVRYLDENGMELIRIDLEGDEGITYHGKDLQNKGDRYYFTDTMKLKKGEVYISPLDLNIEHGKIEQPIKPMLRISTKVHDKNGKCKGIVIVNYYAKIMLADFDKMGYGSTGTIFLINNDGYWLRNPEKPETEFTFMYDDKKSISFKDEHPEAWEVLKKEGLTNFMNDNHIYFATEALPVGGANTPEFMTPFKKLVSGEGNWYIVSAVCKDHRRDLFPYSISERIIQITEQNPLLLILMIIISITLAILYTKNRMQNKKIKYYSEYDQMTSAYNRRAGMEKLNELIKRTRGTDDDICICFMDVNGLKSVNDILGHKHGDALIKSVSEIIGTVVRTSDFLIRYGGDEFILVLHKSNLEQGEMVWKRIVRRFEQENANGDRPYRISISHGISFIEGKDKDVDVKSEITRADENMYEEKQQIKKTVKIIKD